jgi:hypothetical protein
MTVSAQLAIARIWRGRVRAERADEYVGYNDEAGIKPLIERHGRGGPPRGPRAGDGVHNHFYWESFESMSRFTVCEPG